MCPIDITRSLISGSLFTEIRVPKAAEGAAGSPEGPIDTATAHEEPGGSGGGQKGENDPGFSRWPNTGD